MYITLNTLYKRRKISKPSKNVSLKYLFNNDERRPVLLIPLPSAESRLSPPHIMELNRRISRCWTILTILSDSGHKLGAGEYHMENRKDNTSLLPGVFIFSRYCQSNCDIVSGGWWYCVGYPSWYKDWCTVWCTVAINCQFKMAGWSLEIESIGEHGAVQGNCTQTVHSTYSWLFLVGQLESQSDNAQLNFSLTRLIIIY